ncbi:glycoside hydrolase family 99-like domain-containing protein [Pedobacter sp. PLR]|uniref:glycoside hydrolase family 99-like domain-containing protein n=1 Tax=Pedobacter sp. PLR TaxID=2994465 RepID=UPI0022454E24|nr:glycoside hydrolase family 99-like domain-containing protein [Pedobacter sp. PLR]MCX2453241.1 glycoside hydrolase family 99-like domain-containing protein [Pedobacter sp. PLR]
MKKTIFCSFLVSLALLSAPGAPVYGQNNTGAQLKVGAYYFDGWTGKTSHISRSLKEDYKERAPVWGWVTSTPAGIRKQVTAAVNADLDFFTFCWYYSELGKQNLAEPRNNALRLFVNLKDKQGLKFNLLVSNHYGYIIGPADWDKVSKIWLDLFEMDAHLKFNDKPLITFLSLKMLMSSFGSAAKIKVALDQLRAGAVKRGLKGVNIGISLSPDEKEVALAKKAGFDVLTGYNYHDQTLINGQSVSPITAISKRERAVWSQFLKFDMPYIPVSTLNWDPRAWDEINKIKKPSPHFKGYAPASVFQSVKGLKDWVLENNPTRSKDQIAVLYAWNEYGEGAWLTPSLIYKNGLLEAVKKALGSSD